MRELISANLRTEIGKNKLKNIRTQGYMPAIVYGHNKPTQAVKVDRKQIERFLTSHSKGSTADLDIEGRRIMAVVKDYSFDPVKGKLFHMDFQEISANERVRIPVPIHVKNRDSIERIGAVLEDHLNEIEIEALPEHLLEHIEVNVAGMAVGDVVRVADLVIPNADKIELLTEKDLTVLAIVAPQKEEPKAEGATAEEVLSTL